MYMYLYLYTYVYIYMCCRMILNDLNIRNVSPSVPTIKTLTGEKKSGTFSFRDKKNGAITHRKCATSRKENMR